MKVVEPDLEKLARLICAYAPHDGSFELRIPGLYASRFSRINNERRKQLFSHAIRKHHSSPSELCPNGQLRC
jgi:hypothetical protein